MVVKSISRRMSDSVLMVARLTSLSWVMDVRRRFSVSLTLEKERSALQLVTRVWWEAPFWWEAWGPGPHGPSPKCGPVFEKIGAAYERLVKAAVSFVTVGSKRCRLRHDWTSSNVLNEVQVLCEALTEHLQCEAGHQSPPVFMWYGVTTTSLVSGATSCKQSMLTHIFTNGAQLATKQLGIRMVICQSTRAASFCSLQ